MAPTRATSSDKVGTSHSWGVGAGPIPDAQSRTSMHEVPTEPFSTPHREGAACRVLVKTALKGAAVLQEKRGRRWRTLAGGHDVNGDGRTDVVVGAPFATTLGRDYNGTAYVVFGRTSSGTVSLANFGDAGSRIDGAAAADHAGRESASVATSTLTVAPM